MAWTPLAENTRVWTADYRVPGLPCRSWAVELEGGGYVVGSPGASLVEEFTEQLGGPVHFLVAPSSFHWMGIAAWQKRFDAARVSAPPEAVGRLKRKGVPLGATLDDVRSALPEGVDLLEVPATRFGELWLRAKTDEGVAWSVCDAFFNMEKVSHKWHVRLLTTLLKSAPGLRISNLMKWGGVRNRRTYRDWILARLEQDRPTILVPAHGAILRGSEVAPALEELIRRRL